MKFTIEGFSQEAALSMQKKVKAKVKGKEQTKILKLDQTDLILLRWFVDFYPKMKKKIVGEIQYAWVNYQSIVNDLPLLQIEKRTVYNRFSKMCELGILIHYHDKNGGSYSYYGFGEKYSLLIDTDFMNSNSKGYESKFIGGMNSNSKGVGIQIPTKDSSISNSSITNKEKSIKEKVDSGKQSFPPPPTEKKESGTCQKVVDSFNKTCTSLPQVRSLTDKRKRAIKLILKKYSLKELETVFKKVEESAFLNGNSDKWSGATFDWILKESNFIKVLEGNYDDKGKYNNLHSKPSYDIEEYEKYNIFDYI